VKLKIIIATGSSGMGALAIAMPEPGALVLLAIVVATVIAAGSSAGSSPITGVGEGSDSPVSVLGLALGAFNRLLDLTLFLVDKWSELLGNDGLEVRAGTTIHGKEQGPFGRWDDFRSPAGSDCPNYRLPG
jgi:hypothetical protein